MSEPNASQSVSAPEAPADHGKPRPYGMGPMVPIVVAVAAVGLLLAGLALVFWWLKKTGVLQAELSLSIVLIAATIALVVVVSTLSVVFQRLGFGDAASAMGLPEGSIRAIIALLLIVLFFISAIYLYTTTSNGGSLPDRRLNGITAETLAELPATDLKQVTPRGSGPDAVYDVVVAAPAGNRDKADAMAAQLITTVATLVTAIAAFYFGANSVSAARSAAVKDLAEGQK